jgi:uncharacterized phiE125 gp8 family phage protein
MYWRINRTVNPASEPVTLAEAKLHLRQDTAADDALITSLITEAREWAEDFTNRAFITQTWEMVTDVMPPWQVLLARPPLVSVTEVRYIDSNGVSQIMPSADYQVENGSQPFIAPAWGKMWPAVRPGAAAWRVIYQAGYGAAAANVPEGIKLGIKQRIAQSYEARGDAAVGLGAVNAVMGATPEGTLQRFKYWWIA